MNALLSGKMEKLQVCRIIKWHRLRVPFRCCLISVPLVEKLSSEYPSHVEAITLKDCSRDVLRHLQQHGISGDEAIDSELKLLLARAALVR
ncbi:hypothetical protein ACROYT_G031412 [Oculina patagonica]